MLSILNLKKISGVAVASIFVLLGLASHASAQTQAPTPAPACPAPPAPLGADEMTTLAQQARDRGFLWRISKGDRVGYLYGSMHVSKREWSLPGPQTLAALQQSDLVALELDILDPVIGQQMSDTSKLQVRPLSLTPQQKQKIEGIAARVCAPMAAISSMHPVMQMTTLSLFDARFSGLEFVYGSEMFLAQYARGTKKAVRSLETPQIQMSALTGGDPKDLLDAISSGLALMEKGGQQKQTARMVKAWANSDLKELQSFDKWCECMNTDAERRFMQRLNDDRNPGLAAAIDKLIREGRRVFAAVGALHMAGPKPVQKLLAEMGYSVERVDFSAPIEPAAAASKAPPKDAQKVAPKVAPKAESKAAPKAAPASK